MTIRHASDQDLDHLDEVLVALRAIPGLRERRRGNFSKGSKAFLHFHEDTGRYYADVRLTDRFERMPVTSRDERATFLKRVRAAAADVQSV